MHPASGSCVHGRKPGRCRASRAGATIRSVLSHQRKRKRFGQVSCVLLWDFASGADDADEMAPPTNDETHNTRPHMQKPSALIASRWRRLKSAARAT